LHFREGVFEYLRLDLPIEGKDGADGRKNFGSVGVLMTLTHLQFFPLLLVIISLKR
jgi:hypothetical protein